MDTIRRLGNVGVRVVVRPQSEQEEITMRPILTAMSLTGTLCILFAVSLPSMAVGAEPANRDRTHPAASSAPDTEGAPSAAAAAETMQQMQAMHEKMMAAKTPAERQALMTDHMKAMQQGMTMMQHMNSQPAKGTMSSQMMQRRMDMMTMMMQMMMDRQQMGAMPMGGMSMGAMPSAPNASPPPK
jgi:hypothetical protein